MNPHKDIHKVLGLHTNYVTNIFLGQLFESFFVSNQIIRTKLFKSRIVWNCSVITFRKARNHDFPKNFYKIYLRNGLVRALCAFTIRVKFGAPGGFLVPPGDFWFLYGQLSIIGTRSFIPTCLIQLYDLSIG